MNFNESGFIGLDTSNAIEWYPYILSNYGRKVLKTTLSITYMKIGKKMNLNESEFIALSTSNAIEWYPYVMSNYRF